MTFSEGDLVVTTVKLIVRRDGWTFDERDFTEEGSFPRSWMGDIDYFDPGTLCTIVHPDEEDSARVIARKDIIGRGLSIRLVDLELVSPASDTVGTSDE